MNNVIGIVVSILFVIVVLGISKIFERFGKEASRKFIHIVLANWWIIAMIFFDNMWAAATVPGIFVVVNYLSHKNNIIKVMERGTEEKEDTLGTVFFALSLFVLALVTFGPLNNPVIGLCGFFVMCYGDGLAAVVGKSIKSKQYKIGEDTKSVAGSVTMFIVTLIIMLGTLLYFKAELWILKAVVIALIMTVIEAVSIKGTDNISVPLLTSLLTFLMI